jgi:phage terminase small subunit
MTEDFTHGPAMSALTERQRRFVQAMLSDPYASAASWARAAGYSNANAACRTRAFELLRDARVEAAVFEVARSVMATVGPILATHVLMRTAANPDHPQQVRAAELIANRTGFSEKQQIEVVHRDLTGDALIARLRALAERHGLDAEKLLGQKISPEETKVIEHRADEAVASGNGGQDGSQD